MKPKNKVYTNAHQRLIDIANEGQTDKKIFKGEAFTRHFAGTVKQKAELKNPLDLSLLLYEIDRILVIINPELTLEIEWLNKLVVAIKEYHNEIVIANRLLGIKDDNTYDTRLFENVVKEHFFLRLHGKKVNADSRIEIDFKTLVEMVELGYRRFNY